MLQPEKSSRQAALESEILRLRSLLAEAGLNPTDSVAISAMADADGPDVRNRADGVPIELEGTTAAPLPQDGPVAEKALRASSTQHREILDRSADSAILTATLDGRVTNWNAGAARMFGWSEAEVLGRSTARLFTPEDVGSGQVEAEMREALEQGILFEERWYTRRTGERFWGSGETRPLLDDAGRPIGFAKTVRDRAERRRKALAPELSSERNAATVEPGETDAGTLLLKNDWRGLQFGPVESWPPALRTLVDVMIGSKQPMFVTWGPERVLLYNDSYASILGPRHPSAFGRPIDSVWSEIWDDIEPIMERAYRGHSVSMDDIALVMHRNGTAEETHFAFSYTPVRDETGAIAGVFCACQETTEKVRAEAALRRSEERWRGLFEGMQEGFFLAEAVRDFDSRMVDFRFLEVNPAFEAQTGLNAAATIGRTAKQAIPGLEDALVRTYATVVDTGEPATFEVSVASLNGRSYEARARREGPERFAVLFLDITERKKAERALAASQERLRRAQEAGQVGTFEVDLLVDEVRGSDQFWKLYGLAPETVARLASVQALVHPSDRHKTSDRERSLSGQDRLDTEYRIFRADTGEERWIARRADYLRDDSGRPIGLIGTAQDITERRRATDDLQSSEELLRGFMEAIPNQVWAATADGKLDWFNEQVYRYSGLGPGDLDGDRWGEMVHPDDLPGAAETWAAARRAGTVYQTEFRLRRRDGSFRWHLARAVPLRDAGGAVARWVGTNTDIDEQKASSAELVVLNRTLESRVEERTRERDRIWQLSRDPFVIASEEGRWISVSPVWTELLGWTEAELVGRTSAWMEHPADRDATQHEIERLSSGRTTLRFQNRFRTKAGDYRWFSWTAVPQGGLLYCVARDVTVEKQRQVELEQAHEALRQSQKMEAVGQLTGGIAHDFNNLLTGITGSLDLMAKRMAQGRTGDVDRYIRAAMASANRAAALTHRLLAFARRQPLDPKPTDANRLVGSVEDLLRRTLGEAIHLEAVLAGGLWPTLCDPHQLENALLNLAINARDAMPTGGRLTVETCNAHLDENYAAKAGDIVPGQYVCLSVTDTGTGMTPDVVARAFDPFFTTKPIGQGTGLGLSMIYGFARQSDGYVRIYSEPGRGTTVKLYLPRFRGETEDLQDRPSLNDVQRAMIGETVLVVEDEQAVRDLVVEVLSDLGYRALQASDGPGGLRILQSPERIDLLVTDVGLPGINGRQLVDQARGARPSLKVLFITGYAENAMFGNGHLETGMQMLTKPFAVDALAARIREMIRAV